MLHKAVIVHDVTQARAALAAGRPVTLLSAPNAAMFGGCLWWRALLREADFAGLSLLDCGDAPGRALEAIRLGLPGVILTASDAYAAVAIIAAEAGAVMLRQAPPALDLGQRQAERELMAWLG